MTPFWIVTDENGKKFKYDAAGPQDAIEQHYAAFPPIGDDSFAPDVVNVEHIDHAQKSATVWVLTIDHRHGTNTYVNKTRDGSKAELLIYIHEWWDEITGRHGDTTPVGIPEDADEAIDFYFDNVADEYYNIEQVTVGK